MKFYSSMEVPKSNAFNAIISNFGFLSVWYLKHALYSMTKKIVTGMIHPLLVHPLMYQGGFCAVALM